MDGLRVESVRIETAQTQLQAQSSIASPGVAH
jgi:hypothetical protein